MSPPNIFDKVAAIFSTQEFIEEMSIKRVCIVNKALDMSENVVYSLHQAKILMELILIKCGGKWQSGYHQIKATKYM